MGTSTPFSVSPTVTTRWREGNYHKATRWSKFLSLLHLMVVKGAVKTNKQPKKTELKERADGCCLNQKQNIT